MTVEELIAWFKAQERQYLSTFTFRLDRHRGYLTTQPSNGRHIHLRDSRRGARSQYKIITSWNIDRLEYMAPSGRYVPLSRLVKELS